MAKKRHKSILVDGKFYDLALFFVEEMDPVTGIPIRCRLLLDDESVHIKGGENFITAYIPRIVLKDKSK